MCCVCDISPATVGQVGGRVSVCEEVGHAGKYHERFDGSGEHRGIGVCGSQRGPSMEKDSMCKGILQRVTLLPLRPCDDVQSGKFRPRPGPRSPHPCKPWLSAIKSTGTRRRLDAVKTTSTISTRMLPRHRQHICLAPETTWCCCRSIYNLG